MKLLAALALNLLCATNAAAQVNPYAHPCDQFQQREANTVNGVPTPIRYNPLVGVPVWLWFCGPPSADISTYQVTVDGVPQTSTGPLVVSHAVNLGNYPNVFPDAGNNGLVPYAAPWPIVLASPGMHTIRVVYGSGNTVVTFQWLAATCAVPPIVVPGGGYVPWGSPQLNCPQ